MCALCERAYSLKEIVGAKWIGEEEAEEEKWRVKRGGSFKLIKPSASYENKYKIEHIVVSTLNNILLYTHNVNFLLLLLIYVHVLDIIIH